MSRLEDWLFELHNKWGRKIRNFTEGYRWRSAHKRASREFQEETAEIEADNRPYSKVLEDYKGCQVVIEEKDGTLVGEINKIENTGNGAIVHFSWLAQELAIPKEGYHWEKYEGEPFTLDIGASIQVTDRHATGEIRVINPYLNDQKYTVLPRGEQRVDPTRVKGLATAAEIIAELDGARENTAPDTYRQ